MKDFCENQSAAAQVIISVSGGVADVLFKPRAVAVTVFDYDVDNTDKDDANISKDPDGKHCCINKWDSSEQVVSNRHWPIIKQAIKNESNVYRRTWKCKECGRTVNCSYEDLAEVGTPYCADCDIEMQMI